MQCVVRFIVVHFMVDMKHLLLTRSAELSIHLVFGYPHHNSCSVPALIKKRSNNWICLVPSNIIRVL